MELEELRIAVEQGGSARKAADLLGVTYSTVQYWLREYDQSIEKKATLVPRKRRFGLTDAGKQVIASLPIESK